MRPVERAAGGGVARAVVLEHGAIAILDLDRRMLRQELLHPAVERDLGGGKRRGGIAARRERRLQSPHRLGPQRRDRDRKLGGLVLDRVEPVRIGARLLEQPVARAQRALERGDAARMLGIDREHQPVEEAAALGGRSR